MGACRFSSDELQGVCQLWQQGLLVADCGLNNSPAIIPDAKMQKLLEDTAKDLIPEVPALPFWAADVSGQREDFVDTALAFCEDDEIVVPEHIFLPVLMSQNPVQVTLMEATLQLHEWPDSLRLRPGEGLPLRLVHPRYVITGDSRGCEMSRMKCQGGVSGVRCQIKANHTMSKQKAKQTKLSKQS